MSYEDVTAPLRRLLKKDVPFHWGAKEEEAFKKLIEVMNDPATLHPFNPSRPTHIAADSSEQGMQGSIYQEIEAGKWEPIDHASRCLTPTEQRYSPIERESLAQSWATEQFRFYVVGKPFTVWTDHEPLVECYNNRQKPTSKRIAKHRDIIQDLEYQMKHMDGTKMPCDYGSRHAGHIDHLTKEEQIELGFDHGQDIYVRRIININKSSAAIDIEDIRTAADNDPSYTQARNDLLKGTVPQYKSPYKRVWEELCVVDNLILKGDKIVIPDSEIKPGNGNIRERTLEIAHDGHPGTTAMKRYIRSRVWFPEIDRRTEEITKGCLPCQASTETKHRDPLTPSVPPSEVWNDLATDHWGPTPEGKYLLVVIDKLSRFPEVLPVNSTSAGANIEAFDSIFSRHGYCKTLTSDNGPPFNGGEYHLLQQYFQWAGIEHRPTSSAEDPEANGLA